VAGTEQACSGGEGSDSRIVSSGYRRPSRNQNSAVNGRRANRTFMRLSADDGLKSWEQRNVYGTRSITAPLLPNTPMPHASQRRPQFACEERWRIGEDVEFSACKANI
jgi:hypothetical protein